MRVECWQTSTYGINVFHKFTLNDINMMFSYTCRLLHSFSDGFLFLRYTLLCSTLLAHLFQTTGGRKGRGSERRWLSGCKISWHFFLTFYNFCCQSHQEGEDMKQGREWKSQVNAYYGRVTTKRQRDGVGRRNGDQYTMMVREKKTQAEMQTEVEKHEGVTEGEKEQKMDTVWQYREAGETGGERDKRGRMSGIHIGEKGEQQKRWRKGTDEMKGEKESLNKLLLQSEGQWSIVRVWKSGSTHTLHTHTHIYIHAHTLGYCGCSGQFREKKQWVFTPWSDHNGLRAILCVLSTSVIRRKVGPNVWLWGFCSEWPCSTGDSIMALGWDNTTIVLETLMTLVGSIWAGLSSALCLPPTMTLSTNPLWVCDPLPSPRTVPTGFLHLDP